MSVLKKIIFLCVFFSFALLRAEDLDERLSGFIEQFNLEPIDRVEVENELIFQAGRLLFEDPILSGKGNISCQNCHHPDKGTGDALSFSLGEGAIEKNGKRYQSDGAVIRRNSPALYNLGDLPVMFWDARVYYIEDDHIFQTPEPLLNGSMPALKYITDVFKNALDAQVLFPMVSADEMLGDEFSSFSNLEIWESIVQKIVQKRPYISSLLREGFSLTEDRDIHIGHIARSLGDFIRYHFQVFDTPYDRYLKGDLAALNEKAKKGFEVFSTKGACFVCHNGKFLTNSSLHNLGIPLVVATSLHALDQGLFEINGVEGTQYRFKTPGLRNISKTAPYMHNGSFQTLEEVVDHYNDITYSLESFNDNALDDSSYKESFYIHKDKQEIEKLRSGIRQPFLRSGLELTDQEKENLIYFLKNSLTEK